LEKKVGPKIRAWWVTRTPVNENFEILVFKILWKVLDVEYDQLNRAGYSDAVSEILNLSTPNYEQDYQQYHYSRLYR